MRSELQVMVGMILLVTSSGLVAQEPNKQAPPEREPIFDVGQIEVPNGNATEVLKFLEEITQLQTNISKDYRAAMSKILAAQTEASERLLDNADSLTDEQFARAASLGLANRVRNIARADQEERGKVLELVKRQLAIGVETGLKRTDISNASTLASYLERYGDPTMALEAYKSFAEVLKDVKEPTYRRYAESFAGSARRLGLLGSSIELTGKLLDGSEFDWDEYRGKVVLVDFWATWCGPCIAEAPNVRKNYEAYHDRGFEVVGISLDSNRKALEGYIKKEKVPWVNLFEDGAGWKHPMTVKVCSLVADTLDAKLPLDTFIKSIDGPSSRNNAWAWSIRAMYAYRTGDAKSAIEYVKRSHAAPRVDVDYVKATNLPIAAMSHHQLDNHQAAAAAMKEAAQAIQRLEANDQNEGHQDLLIAQILYREAESRISGEGTRR